MVCTGSAIVRDFSTIARLEKFTALTTAELQMRRPWRQGGKRNPAIANINQC
jgi:hypothetical protein